MTAVLLAYLLNAAWQAPLVALGAGLLNRNTRLAASWRCRLGVMLLALAVVLPALQLAPALGGAGLRATALPGAARSAQTGLGGLARSGWSVLAGGTDFEVAPWLAHLLVIGAVATGALASLRLIWGLIAARALVARSVPFPLTPAVAACLQAFARRGGGHPKAGRLDIRRSDEVRGPVVIGVRRPVILAPPGFERLAEDEVRAALLHECAHVARGDYAMNLMCEALSLPLSWHPAVHGLKSGVRSARELACDALASARMGSSLGYARCLVALAQTISADPRPAPQAGLALVGRGDLEMRVRALLRPGAGGLRVRDRIAMAGVLCLVVAPLAALHLSPRLERSRDRADVSGLAAPSLAAASSPARRVRAFSHLAVARMAAPKPQNHRRAIAIRSPGRRRQASATWLAAAVSPGPRATAAPIPALADGSAPDTPVQLGQAASAAGGWIAARPAEVGLARAAIGVRPGATCPTAGRLILVRLVLAPSVLPALTPPSDHRLADMRPAPLTDRPAQSAAAVPTASPCTGAASAAPAPRPT